MTARDGAGRLLIVALGVLSCASVPDAKARGISYSTEPAAWPAGKGCLNKQRGPIVAKEVLMGRTMTVVVSGGSKPISDEAWVDFSPGWFNRKNSDRHTLFQRSCFIRSPDAPASCEGPGCARIVELEGYTWVELSKVEAVDCLPATGGCDPAKVKPGQLAFVVTRKCHELVFDGAVYMLRGPRGERAIMHATADGKPTTEVALPEGWKLTVETLTEPLVVHPYGRGDACFYNVLRDARLQSYHQLAYAGATYP